MKKAYGRRRIVTPLGEMRHSKMSGERAPTWSAHTLKIRPVMRTLKSHKNTLAEFPYYPIQCVSTWGKTTLFIGENVLEGRYGFHLWEVF